MIPWNPIHRYPGMTSHFDSLDGVGQAEATVPAGDATVPQPRPVTERAPLGFVDVRSEAAGGSNGARELPEAEPSATPAPVAVTPHVELAAVADETREVDQAVDDKVPFYKREISLGRRKPKAVETSLQVVADPAPTAEEPQQDAPETDDALADTAEPHYTPEVSFRPDVSAGDDEVEADPEPTVAVEASVQDEPESSVGEPEVVEIEVETEPAVATAAVETASEEQSVHEAPVATEPQPVVRRVRPVAPQKQKKGGGRRSSGRVVGLKIGASQLAAAVVDTTDNGHELVELARTPLEPGIVLDGEVRDAEALVTALKTFFAEQKLPTRNVRIGISSNRIGVRMLDIGGIEDDSRFDNAVRFKAHEVLPIAMSDSVLDYRVIEERRLENGETARKILLVVAPRDQLVPYVEVADRAGLKLAGIDLEALGLLRAFVEPDVTRTAGGTSTVVVAIGHEASTLLVSGGGVCEFTRVFDWGGSTLQEAIAQELQIHPVEAATILRHLSLAGNSRRVEGVDDDARNRALEAVRLRLTPFARELVSSLQFYQTQPDSLGIGEIIITGGTSELDGLADALHQMIGVQVRVGNPLGRLSVHKGVESGFEHSLGSLAVPIGLAIDDDAMRSVDLTPRDVAKVSSSRRRNLVPILVPAAAAIPIVALGFLFTQAHGKVSDRQSQLSSLKAEYAALPEPTRPQIDSSLGLAEAARASAIAQVLGSRTSWDRMLRDISRVLPQNVWLTDLKASVATPLSSVLVGAPGAAPSTSTPATTPTTPQGMTVTGYTFKQKDVAKLLSRLVALPTLKNVQLQSASTATVGKKDVIQFTILADLRGAGGAS
jgi:type IV pilus assembly protein PilM